jgi:hypothetical protein
METIRVTLCGACEQCPTVEIGDAGVRIGEDTNLVKLSHTEWNDLVRKVLSGELKPV